VKYRILRPGRPAPLTEWSADFCWPAPKALVSDETIAEMLSPDPMPVEVTSELRVDADEFVAVDGALEDVTVGVADEAVLDMFELM